MDEKFSNERYARQMLLPEIGAKGQERLAAARMLVVGAGALGTPALYYLAAAGVGTLGIADDDTLELSNLHRQILYANADVGRHKAEAATERLATFNPQAHIEPHALWVTRNNAVALFRDYDLVLDATDRLETKFLINDACAKAERPLIHAAVLGFEARVATFDARRGPCLRCLFPEPPAIPALTCSEAGVLGAVTGMAGSLQALEAVKWILAADNETSTLQTLLGRLWLLDGRTLETRVVALPRDPACPICRRAPEEIELVETDANIRTIEPTELGQFTDALFVDVREQEEWDAGHLSGAWHLPLSRLAGSDAVELPARDGYIVYCAHGIRSQTAARILADKGYSNVGSLAGGLAALVDCEEDPDIACETRQ